MAERIDAELEPWPVVSKRHRCTGILIGNGASMAVWDRFAYASLYDIAYPRNDHRHDADRKLFESFRTSNFEQVLSSLATAQQVNDLLGIPSPQIPVHQANIRSALITAVNTVHIPWKLVQPATLTAIYEALRPYKTIFTTNYDLLVYWALMNAPSDERFKDYFWGDDFNVADTSVTRGTKVLYLHGALHLYRLPNGRTRKRTRDDTRDLLRLFNVPEPSGGIPLFVTEGTSEGKRSAISRSDYLNFAFGEFGKHQGSLVVFGHSLDPVADAHLINAMRRWYWRGDRKLVIGLRPALTPEETVIRKTTFHDKMPEANIVFFDGTTHPLGLPTLRIAAPTKSK